ncbi:MAG: LPS assembly protein LptD [Pseudomonadota bacterium]
MKSHTSQSSLPETSQPLGLTSTLALLRLALLVSVLALGFVCNPVAFNAAYAASSLLEMRDDDNGNLAWELTADKVSSYNDSKIVEASGSVILQRGDEYLKADFARYFAATNWVYLKGNVEILSDKDTITASEAEFDLRNKTGWMKDGEIFMAGPHVYFAGDRLTKKWGDYYMFENAKVTSCPPESKAWSLNAEQAVVEIDGYAQLFGTSFDIVDTSVFYSPYLLMPAKKERQSGLLMPEFGSSTQRGFFYNQPYYWVVDEFRDVTINEYWMENVGFMHGFEYRAHETSAKKTWLRFDYLYDSSTVDSDTKDDVLGDDGYIRTNHDRFWLRGMADGDFGNPVWKYKINLDFVSDQNYLREFNDGMTGFDDSRNALFNLFGRDLTEIDSNRVTEAMIYRDWDRFSMALSARYEQDPSYGHGNAALSDDDTVQTLPKLEAYLYQGRIQENIPVELEASAHTAYFHRQTGTQGSRTEVYPKITVPVSGRYGSVISSFGWRQTMYNTERRDASDSEDVNPTGNYRSLVDFKTEAFTELGRVWSLDNAPLTDKDDVGSSHWTAIYHRIQPRISYEYLDSEDQSNLPYYTAEDRVWGKNEIVYSVTNILTRKRAQVVMKQDKENPDVQVPEVSYDYLDFVRWRLESGYDIKEMRRDYDVDEYSRRPFLEMISDLTLNVNQWLGFTSRAYWSLHDSELTRYDQSINLTDADWGRVKIGHSYRRELDEYYQRRYQEYGFTSYDTSEHNLMTLTADLKLWGPWSMSGHYYYDFVEKSSYEYAVDLAYTHPCYRLVLQYSSDYYDNSVSLRIELPGLTD